MTKKKKIEEEGRYVRMHKSIVTMVDIKKKVKKEQSSI